MVLLLAGEDETASWLREEVPGLYLLSGAGGTVRWSPAVLDRPGWHHCYRGFHGPGPWGRPGRVT